MGNPAESSMSGVRTTTRRVFGFWPFGSLTSAKRMSAKRIGYGAAVVPPLFILVYLRGRRLIVVGLGEPFIDRPPVTANRFEVKLGKVAQAERPDEQGTIRRRLALATC